MLKNNEENPRYIELIDTTLRDGAQAPHVSFSYNDKTAIISALFSAGIRTFEAGIPAMGTEERADLIKLKKLFPQCTFIGWCRANEKDIYHALSCGCDYVHISFPVSTVHMDIIHVNEKYILDSLPGLIKLSRENKRAVSIGAQDATRADLTFLKKFISAALDAGAQRVRIADTVGILSPMKTRRLFEHLLETAPGEVLEFHGHNDFGMATANTIIALETGINYASVTVNGIGERAGNAALEEVVMAIIETTSLHVKFNTSAISSICKTVADITNSQIPDNKPITGKSVFLHKSGIHCNGLIRNRNSYEPYNPELTGHTPSKFCIGTHSGISGIRHILGDKADSVSVETLREFLKTLQDIARSEKKSFSENEVREMFYDYVEL